MKTLHGRLDHVMGSVAEPRLVLEGKTYALPEESVGTPGFMWLSWARQFGCSVTIEIDDDDVVRAATVEIERQTIAFTLPNGQPVIS